MQAILGANGQIAEELVRELHRTHDEDLRLVSRTPKRVHNSDLLFPANLMDAQATTKAVEGSRIAYLTVGLPLNSRVWEEQFPAIMQNVIAACTKHRCKLVFFDNTYMYAKTSEPQTEQSAFRPTGRKSTVRARIAAMLLSEMDKGTLEAVICRAPEFYGPGKTQSITNSFVFDRIKQGKQPRVPLADNTLRTLIWTPDASRAMALIGNTPDAYGQTWHLPCDDDRPTYRTLIDMASEAAGKRFGHSIVRMWMLRLGGLFNARAREVQELLPRYRHDNIFLSDKFKKRFPDFRHTTYRDGVTQILNGQTQRT